MTAAKKSSVVIKGNDIFTRTYIEDEFHARWWVKRNIRRGV